MAKPALGRGLSALLGGKPSSSASNPAGPSPGPGPANTPGPNPFATPASPEISPTTRPSPDTPLAATPFAVPVVAPPDPARAPEDVVLRVPVGRVRPSELQPRRDFPEESLRELADSIREQGILQPLVVRARGEVYELIAGERRWRAAQKVGLHEIPVILREVDDSTALELMLVENLQREGLNPMDEAQGYAELMQRFRLTQEIVATKVGRSRAAVANALRLLRLPDSIQARLRDGRVSPGHAKVILGLAASDQQELVARKVAEESLSVRQTEEWVARLAGDESTTRRPGNQSANPLSGPNSSSASAPVTVRDPHVSAIEDQLRQRLGTKVTLRYRQGRGQIDIRFFTDVELERILEIVGVKID